MSGHIRDRIAQIIRADPEMSAADTILREFAVLHRSEEMIEGHPDGRIVCGSGPEECTAREGENPNWLRNHAANAIALAEYLELVQRNETQLKKRRDELVAELYSGPGFRYASIQPGARKAIDRIIELEARA